MSFPSLTAPRSSALNSGQREGEEARGHSMSSLHTARSACGDSGMRGSWLTRIYYVSTECKHVKTQPANQVRVQCRRALYCSRLRLRKNVCMYRLLWRDDLLQTKKWSTFECHCVLVEMYALHEQWVASWVSCRRQGNRLVVRLRQRQACVCPEYN